MLGGDLKYHMALKGVFSEPETKFFCACMISALEAVHGNHIVHRDVKPGNLVFDSKGYLRLTDFGIACPWFPGDQNK